MPGQSRTGDLSIRSPAIIRMRNLEFALPSILGLTHPFLHVEPPHPFQKLTGIGPEVLPVKPLALCLGGVQSEDAEVERISNFFKKTLDKHKRFVIIGLV